MWFSSYNHKNTKSPGQNHFEEDFRKKHLGFIFGSINHNCRDAIVEIIYKIQPKKQVDGAGKDYKPRDIKTELEYDERSFAILHYFRNYSAHRSLVRFASEPDELCRAGATIFWVVKLNYCYQA